MGETRDYLEAAGCAGRVYCETAGAWILGGRCEGCTNEAGECPDWTDEPEEPE
jgi:hypothetical protein